MRPLILTVVACIALSFAGVAGARPIVDPVPVVAVVQVDVLVLDDPPEPVGCPSLPASADPLAVCPFDPATYPDWQGDDAAAPLWTRCNYDSGDPANPCPHSVVGDMDWSLRCPDGSVWAVYGAEDTAEGIEAADASCDNWESLSLPR